MAGNRLGVRVEEAINEDRVLARLERAAGAWVARGDAGPLQSWLGRELDGQGIPRRLGPEIGWVILRQLAAAWRAREEDWPAELDARVEGLAKVAVAFLRGDSSLVFGPEQGEPERADLLRFWADRLADPELELAAGRLTASRKGSRSRRTSAPPPSFAAERGPLAVFRSGVAGPADPGGNLLAIDHLDHPNVCRLELNGRGGRWLGPSWDPGVASASIGRSRMRTCTTGPQVDLLEWTFRVGDARVVRTAALLRQSQLALIADEVQGPGSEAGMRVELASGVMTAPIPERRGLSLNHAGGSARVWPIGLPCVDYPTERGSLTVEGGALQLRQAKPGRRCWLPLVVSWDPVHNRRAAFWRVLTVSERSRTCPPGVAFAARLGWGPGRDGLVFYRSLTRPAIRAFLGHQTSARFLIGLFTATGEVVPLVRLD